MVRNARRTAGNCKGLVWINLCRYGMRGQFCIPRVGYFKESKEANRLGGMRGGIRSRIPFVEVAQRSQGSSSTDSNGTQAY